MKLYEIIYEPVLCGKHANDGKFVLGHYTDSVIIMAEDREKAIEKFHQGNHGYIDEVKFMMVAPSMIVPKQGDAS